MKTLMGKKFFMTISEFIGQFYFQKDVFELREELGIRAFLENILENFQVSLILQI
jgi:hypothetical protein